ncbi:MAG: glycosyltransferase family 4 protein, partial [Candidatus Cloacimonetes bacterium]|nr:glycosyltransferase family 4 protein [Candidatus Cloacimonadota bacterium]
MKILLINHFPLQGSGSGIYTLNIALELVKAGHSVFVIDIDNQKDRADYPFLRKTILCDEIKNIDPDLKFNFPCFTTHPRSTNTFYKLSETEIVEYIRIFRNVLDEVVAEFEPDIIHAQHLWIAPYVARLIGKPYVITVHGTDLMGFEKDKRYHKYVHIAAENAGRIITISRQVHNKTRELININEDKLRLNPNGFDDGIFKVKEIDRSALFSKFGIKGNRCKVVSFVGKFTDFKGIDVLIKAARIVTDEIADVVFILAGDGELRSKMEDLRTELKLDNIYFVGQQNQVDVASLYNIADVSVVPSRIEPFGLVAIEALACGTPVVATNAGGLPDFIDEKVGQLVEMEDHSALAKAIIEELTAQSKSTKGKYAVKYANDNYSWKVTLAKVIETYREILESYPV